MISQRMPSISLSAFGLGRRKTQHDQLDDASCLSSETPVPQTPQTSASSFSSSRPVEVIPDFSRVAAPPFVSPRQLRQAKSHLQSKQPVVTTTVLHSQEEPRKSPPPPLRTKDNTESLRFAVSQHCETENDDEDDEDDDSEEDEDDLVARFAAAGALPFVSGSLRFMTPSQPPDIQLSPLLGSPGSKPKMKSKWSKISQTIAAHTLKLKSPNSVTKAPAITTTTAVEEGEHAGSQDSVESEPCYDEIVGPPKSETAQTSTIRPPTSGSPRRARRRGNKEESHNRNSTLASKVKDVQLEKDNVVHGQESSSDNKDTFVQQSISEDRPEKLEGVSNSGGDTGSSKNRGNSSPSFRRKQFALLSPPSQSSLDVDITDDDRPPSSSQSRRRHQGNQQSKHSSSRKRLPSSSGSKLPSPLPSSRPSPTSLQHQLLQIGSPQPTQRRRGRQHRRLSASSLPASHIKHVVEEVFVAPPPSLHHNSIEVNTTPLGSSADSNNEKARIKTKPYSSSTNNVLEKLANTTSTDSSKFDNYLTKVKTQRRNSLRCETTNVADGEERVRLDGGNRRTSRRPSLNFITDTNGNSPSILPELGGTVVAQPGLLSKTKSKQVSAPSLSCTKDSKDNTVDDNDNKIKGKSSTAPQRRSLSPYKASKSTGSHLAAPCVGATSAEQVLKLVEGMRKIDRPTKETTMFQQNNASFSSLGKKITLPRSVHNTDDEGEDTNQASEHQALPRVSARRPSTSRVELLKKEVHQTVVRNRSTNQEKSQPMAFSERLEKLSLRTTPVRDLEVASCAPVQSNKMFERSLSQPRLKNTRSQSSTSGGMSSSPDCEVSSVCMSMNPESSSPRRMRTRSRTRGRLASQLVTASSMNQVHHIQSASTTEVPSQKTLPKRTTNHSIRSIVSNESLEMAISQLKQPQSGSFNQLKPNELLPKRQRSYSKKNKPRPQLDNDNASVLMTRQSSTRRLREKHCKTLSDSSILGSSKADPSRKSSSKSLSSPRLLSSPLVIDESCSQIPASSTGNCLVDSSVEDGTEPVKSKSRRNKIENRTSKRLS